ncbi:MAG: hypothetical protein IJW48_01195 [Clostridia bacterium]|nr:hypothetical protein [Clostridia bacterium]
MKITVSEKNGKEINVWFPTWLILNRFGARITWQVLKKHEVHITSRQLRRLVRAMKKCKKTHPGWRLVEVSEHDGGRVVIDI